MKRALTIFGCIALAAIVVAGCGGQSIADDEEQKADVAKIVVKKAQTHCPIMGNPVDRNVFLDHEGRRIYFCCPPCMEKFNEDPEGYLKKLEAEGISLEKVACEHDHDHGDHDHDEDHDDHEGHDHDHDDHDGHDHG